MHYYAVRVDNRVDGVLYFECYTLTTTLYILLLPDALPIWREGADGSDGAERRAGSREQGAGSPSGARHRERERRGRRRATRHQHGAARRTTQQRRSGSTPAARACACAREATTREAQRRGQERSSARSQAGTATACAAPHRREGERSASTSTSTGPLPALALTGVLLLFSTVTVTILKSLTAIFDHFSSSTTTLFIKPKHSHRAASRACAACRQDPHPRTRSIARAHSRRAAASTARFAA